MNEAAGQTRTVDPALERAAHLGFPLKHTFCFLKIRLTRFVRHPLLALYAYCTYYTVYVELE